MKKRPFLEYIEYIPVKIFLLLLRILPWQAGIALGRAIGALAYLVLINYRTIVIRGLTQAFGGEWDEKKIKITAQNVFKNTGQTFFEFLQFDKVAKSPDFFKNYIKINTLKRWQSYANTDRGLIVIICHLGNWETLGFTSFWGPQVYALVRPLDNRLLDKEIEKMRKITGLTTIPRNQPVKKLIRLLRAGANVGFLSDQNWAAGGVFVPFFGRLASTVEGPAVFAMLTGAMVAVMYSHRNPDGTHTIEVGEPIPTVNTGDRVQDIYENTKRYTAELEKVIRKYPDQWLWLHPRWKRRPWCEGQIFKDYPQLTEIDPRDNNNIIDP